MDGDLIEFFMAHEIGQQKSTYMNQPLDELRELYANHEHLLAIEKTSKDEATEGVIPESAIKDIRAQGAKISELEANLNIKGERIAQLEANMKVKNDQLAEFEVKLAEVGSIRAELADLKKLVLEKWREEREA